MRFALITRPAIPLLLATGPRVEFPAQDWWLVPAAALCLASVLIGPPDLRQTRHAVLRNYPVAAHLRFMPEAIRPEMPRHFFAGDKDGSPFPCDQRARRELDKRPFGRERTYVQNTDLPRIHKSGLSI